MTNAYESCRAGWSFNIMVELTWYGIPNFIHQYVHFINRTTFCENLFWLKKKKHSAAHNTTSVYCLKGWEVWGDSLMFLGEWSREMETMLWRGDEERGQPSASCRKLLSGTFASYLSVSLFVSFLSSVSTLPFLSFRPPAFPWQTGTNLTKWKPVAALIYSSLSTWIAFLFITL